MIREEPRAVARADGDEERLAGCFAHRLTAQRRCRDCALLLREFGTQSGELVTEALIALDFANLLLDLDGLTHVYGRRRQAVIRRALREAVPRTVADMAARFQAGIDNHWRALCDEPCPGCGWDGAAVDPAYRVGELLRHGATRQQYLLCAACAAARSLCLEHSAPVQPWETIQPRVDEALARRAHDFPRLPAGGSSS